MRVAPPGCAEAIMVGLVVTSSDGRSCVRFGRRIKNRKQFAHRIDLWDDDGANLVDHLAGVEDLDVAAATYRAACRRWPKAKITLRQGARVVDKSW